MQAVITKEQAKAITGGRTPLVPVEYETACRALVECTKIDEAKYWSDKADALAAWARIYKNDEAAVEARRLKLHAYRRMGELAQELQPVRRGVLLDAASKKYGSTKGPASILKAQGLSHNAVASARKIASLPPKQFDEIVSRKRPPAPMSVPRLMADCSESWRLLVHGHGPMNFRSFVRGHNAKEIAKNLLPDEAPKIRAMIVEISEWLDELEQHLPKSKP